MKKYYWMPLHNLSAILDKYERQTGSSSIKRLELLKGLPFYNDWSSSLISPAQTNRIITTFNNVIGLPEKNGQRPMPLFDYEKLVFDTLHNHKYIWINKATGLGITEFILRYMACRTIS
jgi:hypothetical protein